MQLEPPEAEPGQGPTPHQTNRVCRDAARAPRARPNSRCCSMLVAPVGNETVDLESAEEHVGELVGERVNERELLGRRRRDGIEQPVERRAAVCVEQRCDRLAHPNGRIRQERREARVAVVGECPNRQLEHEHPSDTALNDRPPLVVDATAFHQSPICDPQIRLPIQIARQVGATDLLLALDEKTHPTGQPTEGSQIRHNKRRRTVAPNTSTEHPSFSARDITHSCAPLSASLSPPSDGIEQNSMSSAVQRGIFAAMSASTAA